MMFKQILSYKEILDLSIKKTNLSETVSASKLSRVSELLGDSNSDQSNVSSAGIDMKYGLSAKSSLNMTINPDFGQVESDDVVINFSATETFYSD